MKNLLIIFALLLIGFISEAQKSDAIVQDGILISFEGIDVSKYELEVENFDVEQVTMNHLLCLATYECDEKLALELIEKGAYVNFKCEDVDHVITNIAFCKENGIKLTELLLINGANINGADGDNASFLSYAISLDNIKLAEFLIDKGAERLQRDSNRNMGCLPVHGVKSIEMLELLLSKGFEINELCDNGRNLLHFAAKDNLREVAQYLIDKKLVATNQKDRNGETPLDYTKRFNNPKIAEIINRK